MATGDESGTVRDERGDRLEAALWGSVFLFTFALFVYEFGLGLFEPEEEGLFPVSTVIDFKQTMFLAALIGGGIIIALIVWTVYKHSSGIRDRAAPMRPGEGRFRLVVFVLAVLVVMSTTIFVGAATLAQTDEATPAAAAERIGASQQIHMEVTASQWFWRFDVEGIPYTQGDRVVLPAETLVVFDTTSADVIHSVAIKDLGITKDAIPGQSNRAWFYVGEVHGETTIPAGNGTVPADVYQVRCAELCGKAHSQMIATMYVVAPEDYETWAHAQGGEAALESTGVGGDDHAEEGGDEHSEEESGDEHSERVSTPGDLVAVAPAAVLARWSL
jgi:cytochrome c oxidase subunit 2